MLLAWIKEDVGLKKENVSSMFETEKYRFAGKLKILLAGRRILPLLCRAEAKFRQPNAWYR